MIDTMGFLIGSTIIRRWARRRDFHDVRKEVTPSALCKALAKLNTASSKCDDIMHYWLLCHKSMSCEAYYDMTRRLRRHEPASTTCRSATPGRRGRVTPGRPHHASPIFHSTPSNAQRGHLTPPDITLTLIVLIDRMRHYYFRYPIAFTRLQIALIIFAAWCAPRLPSIIH